MTEVKLTSEQRKELIHLEKQIPFKGLGIRIRIILALDLGYSIKEVAEILLLDEDTIIKWKKRFLESRYLSDWLGDEYKGYQGKLKEQAEQAVEKFVKEGVIMDCQEVVDYIKETFGIDYTINGATKLLHRLDFVYKQTVIIPGKVNTTEQEAFVKRYEKLKKELKETEVILFGDGVHPTHNTQKVRAWVKRGENKQIKTNSGRSRLNIQGAYDVEKTAVVTHYSETINAEAVIAFFEEVQRVYGWATVIYFICDNAKYYKNKEVQAYLAREECRIKLIHLPTYSPNLNFIERLWKYMHQKIIGVKYREKFKEFEYDIKTFFANTDDYKEDLQSFIGTKLHVIEA